MKTKKEIKKEMKKLIREVNESPLNRFELSYYNSLKCEELDETMEGVKYKINFHKRLIKALKKEIKSSKTSTKDLENAKDYISELESSNSAGFEIIKILKAKKLYYELKKEYKNLSKKFKKNTKLSETICRS